MFGSILLGVATTTEAAAIGAGGAVFLAAASTSDAVSRTVVRLAGTAAAAAVALVTLRSLPCLPSLPDESTLHTASLMLTTVLVPGLLGCALALQRRRILPAVLLDTLQVTGMIFGIVIGASMLSLVFRGFGGDALVASALESLPGDEHVQLLVVMQLIFLPGFTLEFVEIIFIVVPLIGPTLLGGSFDPVWLGVLIALNLKTSFLTPSFGFALVYFRSVKPAALGTLGLYRAVLLFVALQIVALCCVYSIPALATWRPGLFDRSFPRHGFRMKRRDFLEQGATGAAAAGSVIAGVPALARSDAEGTMFTQRTD